MTKGILTLLNTSGRPDVSSRSLVFLRIYIACIIFISTYRTWANDWIQELYLRPTYFFSYPFLDVGGPPSELLIYLVFGLIALGCVGMMIHRLSRPATILVTILFIYVQLWDATTYLNHYVLVCLLLLYLCFAPVHGRGCWQRRIPFEWLSFFRFQIACVYIFAALAKFQYDWLILGEPLSMWLRARNDIPILGAFFKRPYAGLVLSWCGFIYDLTIVFFLLHRRTRIFAYLAVIVFHVLTSILFNIGMFPWIMIGVTLIFFKWEGSLPGQDRDRTGTGPGHARNTLGSRPAHQIRDKVFTLFVILNLLIPMRHYFYPGDVMWNEDGMRLSWKVMLREKYGSLKYQIVRQKDGHRFFVDPMNELTWRQTNEMATRPLMIQQYAHHLKKNLTHKHGLVSIYADSYVTLNGQPSRRFINPNFDLTQKIQDYAPTPFLAAP